MAKDVYCSSCGSARFLSHVDGCEDWQFAVAPSVPAVAPAPTAGARGGDDGDGPLRPASS